MKKDIRHSRLWASVVLVFLPLLSWAQPFPVTGNVQLSGTSIPYLEDLLRQEPTLMTYAIVLNDLAADQVDVVLRVSISGNGISIINRPDFIGDIITLRSGELQLLTGFELSTYFNPDHLLFQGITREEFINSGRLPEGFYSLCIEAYDVNQPDKLVLSNNACAMGILEIHDPPIIIDPSADLVYSDVQNITFQWQSMHAGTFLTDYIVYLYKCPLGMTDDQVLPSYKNL